MVNIAISLVGANNDTIQLTDSDSAYILTTGVLGFGIPPAQVRIQESAGNGGTWRNSKRGVRDIDLPIAITGTDRADLELKLRRLANLLQDNLGPTRIVATYSDGTSFQLFAHYVGGGDVAYGSEANSRFARWTISLQAPQPFWESVNPTNYTLQLTAGRGLLPKLSKLQLSGQYGFGDVTLSNPGDVEAYPVWTISGPVDSFTITSNGIGFTYDAPVALGDQVIIDTFAGTVKSGEGDNLYANLSSAPKLFSIPPGSNTVTIAAPGANDTTVIAGNFKPRREVIH